MTVKSTCDSAWGRGAETLNHQKVVNLKRLFSPRDVHKVLFLLSSKHSNEVSYLDMCILCVFPARDDGIKS